MRDDRENELVPLYVSIIEAARFTSKSPWVVKNRLRKGIYAARKAGRRTPVEFASVKAFAESLPVAKFSAPRRRRQNHAA